MAPPEWAEPLTSLRRDGVAVIPDFLPQATVASMLSSLPPPQTFVRSPEADGSEAVSDAHLLPAFSQFFQHPALATIARCQMGFDAAPLRQKIELRTLKGPLLAFDRLFHFDTWKHRLKAFLYLHDVRAEHAPLVYLSGSHRGTWRWPEEFVMWQNYEVGDDGYARIEDLTYLGCYLPHEVGELKRRYGFQERVCVGSAGTLVLFDARGLHRASELHAPYRKILISYWTRPGHHI